MRISDLSSDVCSSDLALHPEVMFHLVADENADFTEANLDLAVRLTDGPGDLEGMVLADAPRVTVATSTAPEQWIDWPGAQLPADIQIGRAACGKEGGSTCSSRWSPYHEKKKKK